MGASLSRPRRLARELQMIRRAFRNWPTVALAGLLWRHLPLPRRDLVLLTRRGSRLVVPLGEKAGALYPALEVFAFSAYANSWRLEEEPYIVDVGAHVGAFTLWLAERYPGLRAVCFEPDPDAFAYLTPNLRAVRATAYQAAVAAWSGTAPFARPIPGGAVSSLHANGYGDAVPVNVESFDALIQAIDHHVSLLKLDCEGSEYDIVLESAPASWARVRRVVLEYHPVTGHVPTELVERLQSFGLTLVRERSSGPVGTYWFSR